MSVTIKKIAPLEIEQESFRIISEELGETGLDEQTFRVIQRVIRC